MVETCLKVENFVINTKIKIHMDELDVSNHMSVTEYVNSTIINKYVDDIYNGIYFIEILKTLNSSQGFIDINGNVSIDVEVHGNGINISQGNEIQMEITQKNRMGYSYIFGKICIFIPMIPEYCNEKEFCVGDIVNVVILGKRVEDKIVCVAKVS